jgi:acetyl-CoA synthetase
MPKPGRPDEPIQALLKEGRRFPPPKAFTKAARVKTPGLQTEARRNPLRFWERQAKELRWMRPWRKTLEWKLPYAKWFVGGKLNVADNCLDRHVEGARRNKAALIWEGEPGDSRVMTYWDLYREVNRFASALRQHGIRKGDPVTIYMPLIPEIAVAMLACARIGAPHSVVFGGFAPDALRDRINDCKAKIVITADGGYRRGAAAALKPAVDEALEQCPDVRNVLVVRRTGQDVEWTEGRDVWWHDVVDGA